MSSHKFSYKALARGVISIVIFLLLWEIGSRSKSWLGADIFTPLRELQGALGFKKTYLPWVGAIPAPARCCTHGPP